MCGIAGILSSSRFEARDVRRLTDPIAHRGPDDEGVWIDADAGIGLGHRRLAIIDVSPAGHQPMESADGRYVVTYNAEIYNHAELRSELEAAGGAPARGLPAYRFQEPVATWLRGYLPHVAHWDWRDAPVDEVCSNQTPPDAGFELRRFDGS